MPSCFHRRGPRDAASLHLRRHRRNVSGWFKQLGHDSPAGHLRANGAHRAASRRLLDSHAATRPERAETSSPATPLLLSRLPRV